MHLVYMFAGFGRTKHLTWTLLFNDLYISGLFYFRKVLSSFKLHVICRGLTFMLVLSNLTLIFCYIYNQWL